MSIFKSISEDDILIFLENMRAEIIISKINIPSLKLEIIRWKYNI